MPNLTAQQIYEENRGNGKRKIIGSYFGIDYNKYTDERFATAKEFQDFLRSGKTLKYDYVIVGDILYTMEEYDHDGKMVVWANRKHNKNMSVMTSDRYKNGYLDAEVAIFDAYGYRTDITYAE